MKDVFLLTIYFLTLLIRLLQPSEIKVVAAESLTLKKQLLVIQRSRSKAPNLTTIDRLIFGWLTMLLSPRRITRSCIILKPSTLLSFHKALVKQKYLWFCSSTDKWEPGHKRPNSDLIKAIVEIKQRNPRFGCPRIALIINNIFGIEINKDVVRRILIRYYYSAPDDNSGSSWLSFMGNMKDSLWSIDLFGCESIHLITHWVLVIIYVWIRRIIGCSVDKGSVNASALWKMFNQIIAKRNVPHYISMDNDPHFQLNHWKGNHRDDPTWVSGSNFIFEWSWSAE